MKKLIILSLLYCSANIHAANTLIIINDVPASVANPTNIFIQLDYTSASISPALEKFEVVYPFTDAINVWTLAIENINSGNLKYGIDPVHAMEQYSKVSDPDVTLMFDGLFEFSLLATDTVGYWDISNVDWIGMLCSVKCTAGGYPNATWQLGYYKKAAELISMVTNEYQFTPTQADQVLIHSNAWSSSWTKLMAPNHEVDTYVDSPGGKTHLVDYLCMLESNRVPVCLKANLPSTDTGHFTGANPPDWTNRVAALGTTPASFVGTFQLQSAVDVTPPIPGPGLTDEIVLVLSNATCGVVLYYSTDGINPGTTYRNDSDGGLWVRYCTDTNAGTWAWVMTNRHLNCVTAGNPSLFEDWVASLANKACYSLNAGLIPTNSNPINVYTFSGYDTLVPTETNTWKYPPYEVNMYNNIIVNNSDSYGMGYSDANPFGAKKVVQQTEKDGAIVELHLLDPDADPTPGDAIAADFDNDGKADFAVVDADGYWTIWWSTADYTPYRSAAPLYVAGGTPVAADFDNDHKADMAMVAPNGIWTIWWSTADYTPYSSAAPLYVAGGVPVAADFDNDHKADMAMVAPNGIWTIWWSTADYAPYSSAAPLYIGAGGKPVAADFDNDHKADMAMVAPNGIWTIWWSTADYAPFSSAAPLYVAGGVPVAADFDKDGKADPTVVGPDGVWTILWSSADYVPVHTNPLIP
ncbi:MAG: FG-GAP-like repeat-containing protein [Kiritimatiellaeota bacterium]|nr:FG-GAP-like repeat-containing protein [Kiritimatiellota bacterium]